MSNPENFWHPKYEIPPDCLPARTLEDLFKLATHYADFQLRGGSLRPTFFCITENGALAFLVSTGDFRMQEKRVFFETCRFFCMAVGAEHCLFTSEMWLALHQLKPGEKFDDAETELPSEDPDRIEVAGFSGNSRGRVVFKNVRIVRRGNGEFFGLGESAAPMIDIAIGDKGSGDAMNFLTKTKVPPHVQELAKMLLALKGIDIEHAIYKPKTP